MPKAFPCIEAMLAKNEFNYRKGTYVLSKEWHSKKNVKAYWKCK